MKRWIIVLILTLLLAFAFDGGARERREEGVGLTIYSAPITQGIQPYIQRYVGGRYIQVPRGFAIVKEWREIPFEYGENRVSFQDVAKLIDPATVHFKSLTDPDGTSVIEQNYEYDLVNTQKLLEKYIDKEIILEVEKEDGKIERKRAVLLSIEGGRVVRMDGKIHINPPGRVILPELPEGLITRPTLVWLVHARRSGTHLTKVTYETKGIMWSADYTAVIDQDERRVDLSAWVTIDNRSGATYKDAEIKLIAGDVHRVVEEARILPLARYAMDAVKEPERGFVEKPFFEYHLYTLKRPSTIKDNSQKQIELFHPVESVPCEKILLYYGNPGRYRFSPSPLTDRSLGISTNKKVDIYLTFKNDKGSGLGIPLPAGKVRVYKEDPDDGSLEFIGEDKIDHTPKDEEVMLKLGCAFDVVGERKQVDFSCNYDDDWMRERFEITLRNHKDEDVEIIVKENLFRWIEWEIIESSHPYEKVDARTIHFKVRVPKESERKVTYTVEYTW
jgi:hypothetical protein